MTENGDHRSGLLPALGPVQLVLLGVGCIIGAGIFVITGSAAADYAGPAVSLSFLLAAFACACAGLCYSELAATSKESGGAYSYTRDALGPRIGWLVGWNLIMEYLVAASFVAVGWSGYLSALCKSVGLALPTAFTSAPFALEQGRLVATGALINLPAALIIGLATLCAVIGVKRSSAANMVVVLIKVTVILVVIAVGAFHIDPTLWTPFIPPVTPDGQYGIGGVMKAAGVVFIAYIGFDAVATTALEARRPQRDVPIGILGSLAVCTILYIAMSLVLTGTVPYAQLSVPSPVALAVANMGEDVAWLLPLVSLGAIAGLTSVILVLLVAQPRVFFAMAQHRILPSLFARVHPRYRTPHISTIITGSVAAALASLFPIDFLAELVSSGTLLAFMMVSVSVIVLRRTRPDAPRPFRVPWVPLVPIVSILVCGYLIYTLGWHAYIRLGIWLAIGIVIYEMRKKHAAAGGAA